jgi:hypothetical protein
MKQKKTMLVTGKSDTLLDDKSFRTLSYCCNGALWFVVRRSAQFSSEVNEMCVMDATRTNKPTPKRR